MYRHDLIRSAELPDARYAGGGDVHIAYQEFGSGDLDLIIVDGFFSHLELHWELEQPAAFLEWLASFG